MIAHPCLPPGGSPKERRQRCAALLAIGVARRVLRLVRLPAPARQAAGRLLAAAADGVVTGHHDEERLDTLEQAVREFLPTLPTESREWYALTAAVDAAVDTVTGMRLAVAADGRLSELVVTEWAALHQVSVNPLTVRLAAELWDGDALPSFVDPEAPDVAIADAIETARAALACPPIRPSLTSFVAAQPPVGD